MVVYKNIFLIFCLWNISFCLTVSAEPIKFKNISIDQGLSQTTVFDITQDKNGNLWIATADGLNKYDSYTFTVYRHRHNDTLSIADNMIRTLKIDSSNNLWIGSMCGLSRFDADRDCFDNYIFTEENENIQVWDVEEIDPHRLLLATNKGIRIFNRTTRQIESSVLLPHAHATTLTKIDRQILVGTQQGLYLYTAGSNQVSIVIQELQPYTINTLQYIPYKGFWIGTEGNGLYFADMNFRIIKHYRHTPLLPKQNISSDFVRAICLDYEQRLWVGTFVGLNIYNAETDCFDIYQHDNEDNSTISQNSIRTIFADQQGGIWLGTYFCGLDYYHPLQNRFGLIRQSLKPNSLKDNVISCITEETATGNLWIGTNDDGVSYYHLRSGQFSYYRSDEKKANSLKSNNIKCILPDSSGNAWIGTHGGGISYIRKKSKKIETYTTQNSQLLNNNVYAILPVEMEKNFWLGTLRGLQLFNPVTRQFSVHFLNREYPELQNSAIFCLFKDSAKRIWIGTNKKLWMYDPVNGQLKSWLQNTSNRAIGQILCIQETQNGHIWVGTRSGLYRITSETDKIRIYTTDDGLPNDVIYGILEDSYERLWLTTNKGLTCFDVKNNTFRTYTEADGIQSNQFNNYSFCKTAQGRFYFGGVKGITYFTPEHLQDNPFTPQATLVKLTLFNREVTPEDASGILKQAISRTSSLTFRSDQNFFGLHFSAPNFLSARKNTFQYKLEGFDKDWYFTDKPQVSYSNLSPGTYLFKLNVANNDGKWSPQTTVLEINILPAWYQTWWTKLLLFGLFLFIGIAVFQYYKARLQLSRNEELSQMKIRFFVNVTHELRTPLTLILSPIQEIMQRGVSDKWLRGQIEYIQRSANRLLNLVNQTLDYRRAELGVFQLKVYNHSAETLAHDIFMLFYKYARQKNITYEFVSDLSGRLYPLDINYLERILLNLLTNAFKYTPEGGCITLSLREKNGQLTIEISDTGCGIAKEEQQKIFKRFYHLYKDQMNTGIGLSLVKVLTERHHGQITLESAPGKGSVFTVTLPASASAYREEEWDNSGQGTATNDLPLALSDLTALYQPTEVVQEVFASDASGYTLLLVGEDNSIITYLSENLRSQFKIYTAANAEEGWDILRKYNIDLILTDVGVKDTNGLKFCKTVKQNISTSHIFVILLIAFNDTEHQLEGLRNGADDYFNKPFVFSVLNAKIHNLLKARKRLENYFFSEKNLQPEAIGFNAADEALLKKCRTIVEKNLDKADFSVDDLSREMGMSRSTLHLKLKSVTGESTIEFIRKIKFDKACQLLQEGRYTIAEISTMVGFNTPSYFAGSFKKQMGCLPTEYIKKKSN